MPRLFLLLLLLIPATSFSQPKISLESLVAQVYEQPCDLPLMEASQDTLVAKRYLKTLEKRTGRIFQRTEVGYILLIPRRLGTYTLWVQMDSLGIRHMTEAWYIDNDTQLSQKYADLLGNMLDGRGEPVEDASDYALWESYRDPNCGSAMVVLVKDRSQRFISRRVWFR